MIYQRFFQYFTTNHILRYFCMCFHVKCTFKTDSWFKKQSYVILRISNENTCSHRRLMLLILGKPVKHTWHILKIKRTTLYYNCHLVSYCLAGNIKYGGTVFSFVHCVVVCWWRRKLSLFTKSTPKNLKIPTTVITSEPVSLLNIQLWITASCLSGKS